MISANEISVIMGMINDNDIIGGLDQQLAYTDFHSPETAMLFKTIVEANSQGIAMTTVLEVQSELTAKNEWTKGIDKVLVEGQSYGITGSVKSHAEMIKNYARGKNIKALQHKAATILQESTSNEEIVEFLKQSVEQIIDTTVIEPMLLSEQFPDPLKTLTEEPDGVKTGLASLDEYIELCAGDITLICGRTGSGKTTLANNLIKEQARLGYTILLVTLETDARGTMKKFLQINSGLSKNELIYTNLSNRKRSRLESSLKKFGTDKIYQMHGGGITPQNIEVYLRACMRREKIDIVYVDHVHSMQSDTRIHGRTAEMTNISIKMKAMAMNYDIPIVLLCQLNRADKNFIEKKPILPDIKDTSALEQDASHAIMVHRSDQFKLDDEELDNVFTVIIAKNRTGQLGEYNIKWVPPSGEIIDNMHDLEVPERPEVIL